MKELKGFLKGYFMVNLDFQTLNCFDFRSLMALISSVTFNFSRALYLFLMRLNFFHLFFHLSYGLIKVSCCYQVFHLCLIGIH